MRYTKYITTLFALIALSACTITDIDNQVIVGNTASGDKITVIGRVTRFDDHVVDSRSTKDAETEGKINNMAVALFPVENGLIGNCVFFEYKPGSEALFTIDRQIRDANGNYIYKVDTDYVMYVFANCPEMANFSTANTLTQMKEQVSEVSGIDIPTNGFPMMGSLGDKGYTADGDGKVFVLKPYSESNPGLPLIDGDESDLLTIPLAAMYAKVNFTIKVTPDQNIPEKLAPRFKLDSYTITNVPGKVDFSRSTNDDAAVIAPITRTEVTSQTNIAIGANTVTFTFYLPERYLTPSTTWNNYEYPFGKGDDIRDQDKQYRQRFKPLLPGDGQNATYVTLTGVYRDHQNHLYDVNYNIYLGEDNYGNFDVQRNREYFNYITIRGISATDDMVDYDPTDNTPVSIDHRVDVERKSPVIISLRRETLLDSHFEVRPMRIRKSEEVDNMDELINAVKVEVANPETTNWIRLERSFGKGTTAEGQDIYITNGVSAGKRKYFTYNLVNGLSVDGTTADTGNNTLVNSTSVVVPLDEAGECIWIYVDENTTAGEDVRSGSIIVTCGTLDANGTFTPTSIDGTELSTDYTLSQHQLFPVTYNSHTYNIEYEEEYLYNFDAEVEYGQTEDDGMQWGLNGVQLSSLHYATVMGRSSGVAGWFRQEEAYSYAFNKLDAAPIYDFYLPRDTQNSSHYVNDHNGLLMNKNILNWLNGVAANVRGVYNTSVDDNIGVLALNASPKSALEYCYNKNKRNENGQVVDIQWYLPAIDEIEDIMMGAYSDFIVFQNKFYWSCQPSYYSIDLSFSINLVISWGTSNATAFMDHTSRARATKVEYLEGEHKTVNSGIPGSSGTQSGTITPINLGLGGYDVSLNTFSSNGELDYTDFPGNMLRTSKARVRCVYKAVTTN